MKQSLKQTLKAVALAILLFVILPLGALRLLWKDRCVDSEVATVRSPDGAMTAATVLKDCGEKMKVATTVRFAPVSDPSGGDTVLVLHGKNDVEVAFTAPKEITFRVAKDVTIVTRHNAWRDFTVKLEKTGGI